MRIVFLCSVRLFVCLYDNESVLWKMNWKVESDRWSTMHGMAQFFSLSLEELRMCVSKFLNAVGGGEREKKRGKCLQSAITMAIQVLWRGTDFRFNLTRIQFDRQDKAHYSKCACAPCYVYYKNIYADKKDDPFIRHIMHSLSNCIWYRCNTQTLA